MKTLSAFVVMLLISLTFSEKVLGGSDTKKVSQKIPANSIQTLINGLNSDNKGVMIGCAIMAGEYRIMETVEYLAKILDSDLSYDVKTAAVFALYQIQNKESLVALKKACIKNSCPYLKQSVEVLLNHYLILHPDENVKVEDNYLAND